jgi:hypothetical protein
MVWRERPDASDGVLPEDEPDFAQEHSLLTTTETVSSGRDAQPDPDIPHGLGGMDLKRLHLLD